MDMDRDGVIAEIECSGMIDSWPEYLCMEQHPDGSVTLASKGYAVLGYEGSFAGEVVWPDGVEPECYDPETNEYDPDVEDLPLPLSIAGQKVGFYEDGNYWGDQLELEDEESTATFKSGESDRARDWVVGYYGSRLAKVDDDALKKIEAALRPPSG